jgi:hypothetical protein
VLRHDTAKVLLFQDSAARRRIDLVARMNPPVPQASKTVGTRDNVIPLPRFSRASGRSGCQTWIEAPPDGEAA